MKDVRRDLRRLKNGGHCITWQGEDGLTYSAEGRVLDVSQSGVGIECTKELRPGTEAYVESAEASVSAECVVAHCTQRGNKFQIGLEFKEIADGRPRFGTRTAEPEPDYYDILQISPKAEVETINRVFRIMAARFHPDNPETGSVEEFLRLKRAHSVLSDPAKRAEYDNQRTMADAGTMPIFELRDFVTGVEAEANRRLGILSLLYNQRRKDPDHPGVSVLELEERMGFPREYLNFSMWYLRAKQFITVTDASDYALTAAGVDHVEAHASRSDILSRLLKPGSTASDGARQWSHSRPANGKDQAHSGPLLLESNTYPGE
jgi:curved DNA-binding protein CbpA